MKYFIFIVFILFSNKSFTQTSSKDSISSFEKFTNKLLTRLSLRQSFQGIAEKDAAAFFNIINPVGKDNSYNYSFALGYAIIPKLNLIPFVEAQKNTLIDKKQDLFLSGAEFLTSIEPKNEKCPTPFFIAKVNYKNDQIKLIQGLQASLNATVSFNGVMPNIFCPLPDVENDLSWIYFRYNPYIGYEYDGRFKAKADSMVGNTHRYCFRLTSNIYPLSKILDKHLEIIPDFSYRKAIFNNSKAENNENNIFKLDINIILYRKIISGKPVELKFGINYTNGVDPSKSFDKQELTTYTFKIKI